MLCGCSLTGKGGVVVSEAVRPRDKVPAALTKPCPPKSRKPLVTTGDIVNRLIYTEGALATCAAQVDGVRRWNEGQKG